MNPFKISKSGSDQTGYQYFVELVNFGRTEKNEIVLGAVAYSKNDIKEQIQTLQKFLRDLESRVP